MKYIIVMAFLFVLMGSVSAAIGSTGFSSFVSYPTTQPGFSSYYSTSDINSYWPILGDKDSCTARQDLMLHVSPTGCQPTVVRSDLLADQNVPVFCQIDALQLNPFIDIKEIRNIRFSGKYPAGVISAGFHPARAAIKTRDQLLGDPLINNIGYVVVILKRTQNESSLPEFINLNLTAQIDYNTVGALGVGTTEFRLKPSSESEWAIDKNKQSFWNGRFSVRLEGADANTASISLYSGSNKITNVKVENGKTSGEIYVPGLYCQAGLQVAYDGIEAAQKTARIEVTDSKGTDTIDVYPGMSFLDGNCRIAGTSSLSNANDGIIINSDGQTGSVVLSCNSKKVVLSLNPRFAEFKGQSPVPDKSGVLAIEIAGVGVLGIDASNQEKILVNKQWAIPGTVSAEQRAIYDALRRYKEITASPKTTGTGLSARVPATQQVSSDFKEQFANAVSTYEQVAADYPAEKKLNTDSTVDSNTYGEDSLIKAIELAKDSGQIDVQMRLIQEFIEIYPTSDRARTYTSELGNLYVVDSSLAGEIVDLGSRQVTLRLVSLDQPDPKKTSKATISVFNSDASSRTISNSARQEISLNGNGKFQVNNLDVTVSVTSIGVDRATVKINCGGTTSSGLSSLGSTIILNQVSEISCGNSNANGKISIRLDDVTIDEVAKVRLIPISKGAGTQANLSVTIGIEKRAIQLSPAQTQLRIDNLNKSINQWEKINKVLGNVVSGMQAACFGTAGVLTLKSFIAGISGETAARQKVMSGTGGWDSKCKTMFEEGKYSSIDDCFSKNEEAISQDIRTTQSAMAQVNKDVKDIQTKYKTSSSGLGAIFGDSTFDQDKAKQDLADLIVKKYPDATINAEKNPWVYYNEDGTPDLTKGTQGSDKNPKVSDVLSGKNLDSVDYLTVRDMYLSLEEKKGAGTNVNTQERADAELTSSLSVMNTRLKDKSIGALSSDKNLQLPLASRITIGKGAPVVADVKPIGTINAADREKFAGNNDVQYVANVIINGVPEGDKSKLSESQQKLYDTYSPGSYVVGLKQDPDGKYSPVAVKKPDGTVLTGVGMAEFNTGYGISYFISSSDISYNNKMSNPMVRYYETEPYRGLPAVVPFDRASGWYAATKQTLPVFGNIGSYDASGKVNSVWLCNAGEGGVIEFDTGLGNDVCQQFNLNTGQSYGSFPGLSEAEAKKKVNSAIQAITQASQQYGPNVKQVTINVDGRKEVFQVGRPMANVPGKNCQDYYSVSECKILFNVCDPVICPPSRCDFGGKYPVANVQQTGIVGSTLLCLPNIKEGIIIPVCLSGIQAGVDSYVSLLKNHRDCLQENLKSGQMVGICDQIYSIYACEFFWSQVAPVANALIPKLGELVTGKTGMRGGGEYGTFSASWQNTQSAIKYFTDTYAVNTFKAFQARNIEEAGTPVCRAFLSAKAPTSFKSLITPESPPQFTATFSSSTYTTATVPATADYKVFYHIFAGKDSGVSFRVYLRNPPESSYYSSAAIVQVASGFIRTGEYASETKDFTAPDGYKELCVDINGQQKCGFKSVSTDFAVNYLRDTYVKSALTETGITSGSGCVSGSSSIESVMANTISNPQSTAEEVINPQIYQRGIVRICSTNNPGSSTNPTRFIDVGYCDDSKIRCWLDKNSVDNSITTENVGVKNNTLKELQSIADRNLEQLRTTGEILSDADAVQEVGYIEGLVSSLAASTSRDKAAEALSILTRISAVWDKVYLNHQKAKLLMLKGDVYAILARDSFKSYANTLKITSPGGTGTADSSNAGTTTNTASAGLRYYLSNGGNIYKTYDKIGDDVQTGYYIERRYGGSFSVIDRNSLKVVGTVDITLKKINWIDATAKNKLQGINEDAIISQLST
ncbi:MAG: hypothetical protein WCK90_03130 [archaeon]